MTANAQPLEILEDLLKRAKAKGAEAADCLIVRDISLNVAQRLGKREKLERSDIRIDTSDGSTVDGKVLRIDWIVSQVDGSACIPLEGVPRVVCDYIAGMTDRFALEEHRKLFDPLVKV